MTIEQAVKLAIEALEAETRRLQIEADLYDVWSKPHPDFPIAEDFRTPRRAAASKHRAACREAILVLGQMRQVSEQSEFLL